MSWLNHLSVPAADHWAVMPVHELLNLLPRAIDVYGADDCEDNVPPELEWASTHYRFLAAALLSQSPQPIGSRDHTFSARMGDTLVTTPPGRPHDWNPWFAVHGEREALAFDYVINAETVRRIVEWLRFGEEYDPNMPLDRDAGVAFSDRVARLTRQVVGYPWRPHLDPAWQTGDVLALARGIWADRAWDRTPILADALQDAGCDRADILDHLRDTSIDRSDGDWAVIDVLLPAPPV